MLAAGLGWATGAQADTSPNAGDHGQRVLFLIPTGEVGTFQQALSSDLRSQISTQPADVITMHGIPYSAFWIPADRVNELYKDTSGQPFQSSMMMVLSLPQFENQAQAASSETTTSAGKEATSYQSSAAAQAAPSTPGTIYTWQGKDVLLIPADQAASFDRSSAAGRDIMVVVPYDQWRSDNTTASTSIPGFDRSHVLLLVPADQVKNFSQLSSDKQAFVVMPLDQYNQMVAGAPAASAVQPSREPTSYQAPAAQPYAENERLVNLPLAGESTAIKEVFPTAAGNVVILRDGIRLLVPDSVDPRGDLKPGNRFRGQYEQRGGENLVTWLELYQPSGGDVQ